MLIQGLDQSRGLRFFQGVLAGLALVLWSGCASHPTYRSNYSGSANLAPGNTTPEFSSDPAPTTPPYISSTATPGDPNKPLQDSRSTTVVPATTSQQPRGSIWSQTDLLLGPRNVIARPGSEVILTAGLRDKTGHLLTNQRIDWNITPNSVGHFSQIQERELRNILVFDFVKPKIISDTQAVTTTSRSEITLDRGTPNLNDDIVVRRGESWISVTSPREGMTVVNASATQQSDGVCKTQSSRIVWVDAAVKLPESRVLDFGSSYTLTTALRRVSDERPLERWRIRYQIMGNSTATFGDGNKMLEVYTNYQGEAKVTMRQPIARQEETLVNIQIIRPADENFSEAVIVQESKLHFSWRPNTINIQKTMPSEAHIGEIVPATIFVTNLTNQPLQNVRIVDISQPGLVLKGAGPLGSDAPEGRQWLVTSLAPGETYTIQLNYRIEQPGSYLSFSRVQTQKMGSDLTVECSAQVSAGSDTSPYQPELPKAAPAAVPPEPYSSPATTTPEGSPNSGSGDLADPFDGTTKALPPPPDSTEDVYVPGGSADSAPATPPLKSETSGTESKTSEIASQSPQYAPVFPNEDPDAQLGLDIVAPARVKNGETFRVFIQLANRTMMDMHNVGIQVGNTRGLSNQNPDGDLNFVERNIQVVPQQKMTRIRTDFVATVSGDQVIEVKLILSNGKEYRREARLRVLEKDGSEPAKSEEIAPPVKEQVPSAADAPEIPPLALPETKQEKTAEKTEENTTIGDLLGVNSSDNSGLTISLKESDSDLKAGDSFSYDLKIANSRSETIKKMVVLFALPTENAVIQKDSVTGPGKADLDTATGMLSFTDIPDVTPGSSVQFSIPVKTLKAGAFQAQLKILEDGTPKAEKAQETRVK